MWYDENRRRLKNTKNQPKTAYITFTDEIPTMKTIDNQKSVNDNKSKLVETTTTQEKIDFSNVVIEPLFKEFVDFDTFSKSDFRAVKVLSCEAVPKSNKLLKFTLDDGTGTERTILSGIRAY
jgi:EMAP domain